MFIRPHPARVKCSHKTTGKSHSLEAYTNCACKVCDASAAFQKLQLITRNSSAGNLKGEARQSMNTFGCKWRQNARRATSGCIVWLRKLCLILSVGKLSR